MFGIHLTHIFTLFCIFLFGVAFFSTDYYLPKFRTWKSTKLLNQSKVYFDESIDNAGGLLDEGVKKAKIAHLLDPGNQEVLFNFIKLRFRTHPTQALLQWSNAIKNIQNLESRSELFSKSLSTLKDDQLSLQLRKLAGEIAFREINRLLANNDWASNPENILQVCELLAETGKSQEAHDRLSKLLDEFPAYPEGVFLLTRLTVHLKDVSKLAEVGKSLASLSTQRNKVGVDAIRHMTLLHLLNPLSPKSLQKCIELLQSNPESEPIDFMRIYALQYATSLNENDKKNTLVQCSELFDLSNPKELFVYCRWLARLYEFSSILEFLPPSKARVDENLFKLRMTALAQQGELESIHAEVANAPLIPSIWRMIVEARAFSMAGKYESSLDVLDRLIPLLNDDPREIRAVCNYLEASKDIRGLSHVLEKLSNHSIHSKFALSKLIQHRAGSAPLDQLSGWLEKLSMINSNDLNLKASFLYVQLLNPQLASPSIELNNLISEALSITENSNLPQARISLALGHLRNQEADKALVALGKPENWRNWANTRGAWSFLASQIYRLNKDSEKALVLSKNVNFTQMDRAEKESLQALFPEQF